MEGDIVDAGELRVVIVHLRDLLAALLGGDLVGRKRRQLADRPGASRAQQQTGNHQ